MTADLDGRVCVITGGNRGIGRAAAEGLAALGATVCLISRSPTDGATAAEEIRRQTGNPNVKVYQADLASQTQIRTVATTLCTDHPAIDVLINNAGLARRRRYVTSDGIEMVLAVNHLAPFLLTHLLLDALKAAAPSRVINVASEAHQGTRLEFDDLQNENGYFGLRTYAQSKLANVYFTYELDRRLKGTGVVVNCMHPGFVATRLLDDYLPFHFITRPIATLFAAAPEDGADTIVWLASSPDAGYNSGKYWFRRKEARSSLLSLDKIHARTLWDESERLTGARRDGHDGREAHHTTD